MTITNLEVHTFDYDINKWVCGYKCSNCNKSFWVVENEEPYCKCQTLQRFIQ